jgi:nucleoside-diphosphate-sugar epimerase
VRILVTGGAGRLGQALSDYAIDSDIYITRFDIAGGPGILQGDISDQESIRAAVTGHDAVIHAAALHGIHLKDFPPQEFLRINVQGTDNVLRAAHAEGIGKVVLLSSTSVYGLTRSENYSRTTWVDETTPCKPRDYNDLCKVLCEELAQYAVRQYGLSITVLRAGRFFVDDAVTFNLAKLSGAVDVADVAQAAIRALTQDSQQYQVFCISSMTNFLPSDLADLAWRADLVTEERHPGASRALAHYGRLLPRRLHRVVSTVRAQDELGYRPTANFVDFVLQTLTNRTRTPPLIGNEQVS